MLYTRLLALFCVTLLLGFYPHARFQFFPLDDSFFSEAAQNDMLD